MKFERVPYITMLTIYLSYLILIIIGNIKDLIAFLFDKNYLFSKKKGFIPIYSRLDSFFIRRMYTAISDCFNRPITKYPSKYISLLERKFVNPSDMSNLTGRKVLMLNFGSYNYLGYCSKESKLNDELLKSIDELPISICGTSKDIGIHPVIRELEQEMAVFLGKEDCVVFSMGFGTNSTTIPVFTSEGDLIISDELNHMSIIYGSRLSFAKIKTFPHNNILELEKLLRNQISQGQPVTFKPWKRIFVLVEGIYSMEGTILKLKEIIELKKKYKFYLFIDEAHSLGAIGNSGRGICEFEGVNPQDVDLLMGTFSKSFSGVGGFIASSKKMCNFLRMKSDFSKFGEQMSPIIGKQILLCLKDLKKTNIKYTETLMKNSLYMRNRLIELGYVIFGDNYSPIIPLMIFNPGKIGEFSRLCYEKGLAVVVVGYPATPVIASRVRLCMSYLHTKEEIDIAIEIIDYAGKILKMNILKK